MLKTCYLCQTNSSQKAFTKLGFTILRCRSCELYALDFDANYQQFIKEYYNRDFFTGADTRAGYADYQGDSWPERSNMNRYLSRIMRFRTSGKLLDVGCATGLFMSQARNQGFDVYGFDVSDYAINLARQTFPKKVKKTTVSQAKYQKDFFDIITLWDVVEHLQTPREDLKHLSKFLKKDGLLMINTGDAGSLLARLEGKNWHFFIPPQHLFFFSRQTISTLLGQAGFRVLQIDYKGKWVSMRYLLHLAKQIRNNSLAAALLPLVSSNYLGKLPLYLNLFDNMVVYAKKVDPQS